jgi:hypothetical protein
MGRPRLLLVPEVTELAWGGMPELAAALRDFCDGVGVRDAGLGAVTGN